jgi:tetratricopeptide (TPR) repeat protein
MLGRAKETFERLIRDDPHAVEYRETLATALGKRYRQTGRTAEAIRAYQRARDVLEGLPYGSADGLYNLAGVQVQCSTLADEGTA